MPCVANTNNSFHFDLLSVLATKGSLDVESYIKRFINTVSSVSGLTVDKFILMGFPES